MATLVKDIKCKLRDVDSTLLDLGLHILVPTVVLGVIIRLYGKSKNTYVENLTTMTETCVIAVVLISFLMSATSLITTIIKDKSSGIKEILNAHGQRRSVHIVSILLYQILLNITSCMIYGCAITQIYFL